MVNSRGVDMGIAYVNATSRAVFFARTVLCWHIKGSVTEYSNARHRVWN